MRLIARFPLGTYFAIVYPASVAALIVIGLPRLPAGGSPNPASLAIFPLLVVTVGAAGAALTAISGRRKDSFFLCQSHRKTRPAATLA